MCGGNKSINHQTMKNKRISFKLRHSQIVSFSTIPKLIIKYTSIERKKKNFYVDLFQSIINVPKYNEHKLQLSNK